MSGIGATNFLVFDIVKTCHDRVCVAVVRTAPSRVNSSLVPAKPVAVEA